MATPDTAPAGPPARGLERLAGSQPDDVAGLDAQLGGGIRLEADDGHPVPGVDENAIRTRLHASVRPDPLSISFAANGGDMEHGQFLKRGRDEMRRAHIEPDVRWQGGPVGACARA